MEIVKRKDPVDQCPAEVPPTSNEKTFFKDNLEYLEALVFEAKIRLAVAYLRENSSYLPLSGQKESPLIHSDKIELPKEKDLLIQNLFPGEVTLSKMESFLEKVVKENKKLTEGSFRKGIEFPLEHICSSFRLDPFEISILTILTAKSLGKESEDFFNHFMEGSRNSSDGGMEIEALINIIRPGFREKFENQKYFGQAGSLIKEEIVFLEEDRRNMPVSSILKMSVSLADWTLRYILGDRNIYGNSLSFIFRDRIPIDWERVILAEKIKDEIIKLAENYSRRKTRIEKDQISQFYGYGKGLTFLFSGPSGTGKTMLAHALANRLKKDLLSLNLTAVYGSFDLNIEDAIRSVFREARLSEGIVFFDECDDIFREDSSASRILLIEIEKADCITILATNEIKELDPALDRRIIMQVPFYLPDEIQREQIWKTSIPPGVIIEKEVDFKYLARKYIFSGGLIKNTLLMAIQNGIHQKGGPSILLTKEELEETADWQTTRMLEAKGIEKIYQPQVRLDEIPIRSQEKKWFQKLISLYKKTTGEKNSGFSFVVGSSDIQTGISCIEGVAAACRLRVKRFSFSNVVSKEDQNSFFGGRSRRREISILEYAFKFSPGQGNLLLFTDQNGDFGKLLEKKQENENLDLAKFLNQLRSFPGIFFLVTKPILRGNLPIEFHHYIELKPPIENIQLRQWEAHLKGNGYNQEELLDLIERHPLHLREIDNVAQLAQINGLLQEDGASLGMKQIYKVIQRLKGKTETPILFGPGSSFCKK
jgi:AAA+ superfamily predicted ATPase